MTDVRENFTGRNVANFPTEPRKKSRGKKLAVIRDSVSGKSDLKVPQAGQLDMVGRLAGGIAHEFNNMLVGIMGYSEILISELQDNPQLQKHARVILETAQRTAKITRQLLAFSGKGKTSSRTFDLHTSITSTVELLKSTTDRRILVISRLGANTAQVFGDPVLLESALMNLGINAREAISVVGVICVGTETVKVTEEIIGRDSLSIIPGEYIELTVSDTGSGMSDEVKSHLFEPFFTTKKVGQGIGLGLAAVYGTIKEHHGDIIVESNPEKGTVFKIYLPTCRV